MKKCYIITAYIEGSLRELVAPEKDAFLMCADGGVCYAQAAGLMPDMVLGDFDSTQAVERDPSVEWVVFPTQKDESDTFLCIQRAVSLGFDEITVIGGMGGRLDHTLSNIQTLAFFSESGKKITFIDEKNFMTLLENGRLVLPRQEGYHLSLFSLTDRCTGVSTQGLFYPLRDAVLKNTYPLGLSNEFVGEDAVVEVKSGKLLVILSKFS